MLLTDFFRAALLDHHLREEASVQLTAYHLALTSDIPQADGSFTEMPDAVWTNYGRAELAADSQDSIFAAATAGLGDSS